MATLSRSGAMSRESSGHPAGSGNFRSFGGESGRTSYQDDLDVEPMNEELSDDELGKEGDERLLYEGPTVWEDVDTEELERIALNISRNALPTTENSELSNRLAMAAAALEADNLDPLGLGKIDTHLLALIRTGQGRGRAGEGGLGRRTTGVPEGLGRRQSGGGASGLGHRQSTVQGGLGHRQSGLGHRLSAVSPGALEEIVNSRGQKGAKSAHIAKLRNKVLPSSQNFDPELYLGLVHAETTVQELKAGRLNLKNEVLERTGQLKALVKENFDRFISCKSTIDDIHVRLQKAEMGVGPDGTNTALVTESVAEAYEEARRAFLPMLERQAKVERIKSVIAMLKRYESLFRLPTRIRQETERREYEQVISEYRKAKGLMATLAGSSSGVWHNLFLEVEKGVEVMSETLLGVVRSARSSPAEAQEAIKHLLQLQADGARCLQGTHPVRIYLDTQDAHVRRLIEDCIDEYNAAKATSQQRDKAGGGRQQRANGEAGRGGGGGGGGGSLSAGEVEALKLVSRATGLLVRQLPALWHLPQERLAPLAAISPATRDLLDDTTRLISDMVQGIMDLYKEGVGEAVAEVGREGASRPALLLAVRELASGCIALKAELGPPLAVSGVQALVEQGSALCMAHLLADLTAAVQRLAAAEDWAIVAASHKAGAPVSQVPGLLREAVVGGLEAVKVMVGEGGRAGVNTAASSAPALRHAFFNCFTTFAVVMEELSSAVLQSATDDKPGSGGQEGGQDKKLLVLLSNCGYVRRVMAPQLAQQYSEMLAADGAQGECGTLARTAAADILKVEGRLASVYIDSKAAALDDALEEYFFGDGTLWEAALLPARLRDAVLELLHALVAVEAEVYLNAPDLRRRVLSELVEHLLATFSGVVVEQLMDISSGGVLQLLLELLFMQDALQAYSAQPPLSEMFSTAADILVKKVEVADNKKAAGGGYGAERLQQWQAAHPGATLSDSIRHMLQQLHPESRMNVLCFRE